MSIYGVALLAICALVGTALGDLLGVALHVKSNVGGVGLAMGLLIAARTWLDHRGKLSSGVKFGVEFWGSLYIPIVVAMAATQNVIGALDGGPIVVIAAVVTVALCLASVALLGKLGRGSPGLPSPDADHAEHVLSGDPV